MGRRARAKGQFHWLCLLDTSSPRSACGCVLTASPSWSDLGSCRGKSYRRPIVARHPSIDRGVHVQPLTRIIFWRSDCEHGFMNRVSGPTMRHSWNMLERVLCMVLYVIVHYPLSQASDLHVLPHFDCTNSKVSLLLMPFDTTVDGCE